MILVGQYDRPVTRRVAIALHHYGMPFTRDTRSIFGDAAAVAKISPLTRIPALVLDDGEVLIDSAANLKLGGQWRDHERWAILADDGPL
jgi:glutathione S-transferase